jgi:hypothetical protein
MSRFIGFLFITSNSFRSSRAMFVDVQEMYILGKSRKLKSDFKSSTLVSEFYQSDS